MTRGGTIFWPLAFAGVTSLACASDDLTTTATGADSEDASEDDSPSDLPLDPRWCVEIAAGETPVQPQTEAELACAGELSPEACEADPDCTAVFGSPIECPAAGLCVASGPEFLGCIPFTLCLPGNTTYCREVQSFTLGYLSLQSNCTPFGMVPCTSTPEFGLTDPPTCGE